LSLQAGKTTKRKRRDAMSAIFILIPIRIFPDLQQILRVLDIFSNNGRICFDYRAKHAYSA
jgi:hypothetical protein